jgi:hypothetical protein
VKLPTPGSTPESVKNTGTKAELKPVTESAKNLPPATGEQKPDARLVFQLPVLPTLSGR